MKWLTLDVVRQLAVALVGAVLALGLAPTTAPAVLRALCAVQPHVAQPAPAEAAAELSALKLFRQLQIQ